MRRLFCYNNAESEWDNEGSKELLTFRVDTCGIGRSWSQISPIRVVTLNTVQSSNGSLSYFSNGSFKDASFSLRLPKEQPKRHRENHETWSVVCLTLYFSSSILFYLMGFFLTFMDISIGNWAGFSFRISREYTVQVAIPLFWVSYPSHQFKWLA